MSNQWFRISRGEAQDVEYDAENSTTTAINFRLNDLLVTVPGQANNLTLIKDGDQVDVCGRPSLFDKTKTICVAYRIGRDGVIHSINEVRDITMVLLGCVFSVISVTYMGWKWPLILIACVSIYYAISAYWSFRARACLARQ